MIRFPLACVEAVDIHETAYRVELCRPEQIYAVEAGWHWVVAIRLANASTDATLSSMYLPGHCSLQAFQIAVMYLPHWLRKKGIQIDEEIWYDANRIVKPAALIDAAEFIAGCTFSCRSRTGLKCFQIVLFVPPLTEEYSSMFVHMGEVGTDEVNAEVIEVTAANEMAIITECIREVHNKFIAMCPDETAEFLVDGYHHGGTPLSYREMMRMLFGSTYSNMFVAPHESVNWTDPFLDKEPAVELTD